ncbi:DNA primase large subunit-like [Leptopilina heterotoma]|uniref:DNA primase large subunit-like n=1 Tax=Leptopilina heterotoma TaxID=63436 RepID=UPI001CA8DE65|nr:DNA primase large subunit-like [Leptopilina heterotoma]XP_043468946.1 DNA primase large subunit-like [Leptopilina heterotoma]
MEEEMETDSSDDFTDEEIDIAAVDEELNKAIIGGMIDMEMDVTNDESLFESELMKNYPHDLQMYRNSLIGKITLDELENLGLERLQVLRIIDTLKKESQIKKEDFKECLLGTLRNKGYDSYVKLITSPGCDSNTPLDLEIRRRDHVSHFILKVALCRKTKIYHWFIKMEINLFNTRFRSLNENGMEKFLIYNDFIFPILSEEEKNQNRDNLLALYENIDFDQTVFYKVPYLKVRYLVQCRNVLLKRGIVFLPITEIIHVASQAFGDSLTREREQYRYVAKEDSRLVPILKKFFIVSQSALPCAMNSIDLKNLDEISEKSFPLCMRTMHEALRKDHHLKNDGRFQYGIFLKIIGLSFDSAVDFWKEEFLKKMPLTQFNQEYLYNIRYIYGLVGQKANYQTYSCASVIKSRVSYGQYHGCPYKNMTPSTLNLKLKNLGVSDQGLVEIEDLVTNEQYKAACTKCFSQMHKVQLTNAIESPVEYYNHSNNEIIRKKRIKIKMDQSIIEQTQENKDASLLDSTNKNTKEQTEVNIENSSSIPEVPLNAD